MGKHFIAVFRIERKRNVNKLRYETIRNSLFSCAVGDGNCWREGTKWAGRSV